MSRPLVSTLALLSLGLVTLSAPQQARAQKPVLTTLHSFTRNNFRGLHGLASTSVPTRGTDGNLYGTTEIGGADNDGTIYSITPDGHFKTLWAFNKTNGQYPLGALRQGADGAFYGTTLQGGSHNNGNVFRITPAGRLTVLHDFLGGRREGARPYAQLLAASDGSFYGTTASGGASGAGTVFHMLADGTLTNVHIFSGTDGQYVYGPVVFGSDGALYGTTNSNTTAPSDGTVFRLTKGGQFSTLHTFAGDDGRQPDTGVTLGMDGALYGTTTFGGLVEGYGGVVFRITPSGAFTVLYKFTSNGHGYAAPSALTLGGDGSLYGSTAYTGESDGSSGQGTLFTITPDGALTTLYKFHTPYDDSFPNGVILGEEGVLYGTTSESIFKLTLPQ